MIPSTNWLRSEFSLSALIAFANFDLMDGQKAASGTALFYANAYKLRANCWALYDFPHGMIGTVLIALAGEPLTIFELTAR
jgi:hypothetical protein